MPEIKKSLHTGTLVIFILSFLIVNVLTSKESLMNPTYLIIADDKMFYYFQYWELSLNLRFRDSRKCKMDRWANSNGPISRHCHLLTVFRRVILPTSSLINPNSPQLNFYMFKAAHIVNHWSDCFGSYENIFCCSEIYYSDITLR